MTKARECACCGDPVPSYPWMSDSKGTRVFCSVVCLELHESDVGGIRLRAKVRWRILVNRIKGWFKWDVTCTAILVALAYIYVAGTVFAIRHPWMTDTQRALHVKEMMLWKTVEKP